MWIRILCLLAFGLLCITICNAAPLNSNEAEARKFVDGISEKIFTYYDRLSRDSFNLEEKESDEAFDTLKEIFKSAKALVEIANQANSYDVSSFTDEELKRILVILRRLADEAIVGEEDYLGMMISLSFLEETASDKDIKAYNNESALLAYYPDIHDIIANSSDPDEIKYYWLAWREKNDAWVQDNFQSIVSLLLKAANLTSVSPQEFWLNEYNMTEMTHAMTQLQPFYKQLHAFIREQLHKKYGSDVIQKDGLIPDHLYQQVLAQIWSKGSVINEMFPYSKLPPYDALMEKEGYNTMKMYKMADKFYRSLGFEPIPDKFWGTQIKSQSDKDEGDCKPTIFDMSSNVYMQFCHKMDFRKFLQAHGYLGRLYYAREKHDLPAYYFPSYQLEDAVGEAVVLSASTPKHLTEIGLVKDFEFTEEVMMNRLMRMSMHTMLNIPVFYVHVKVMTDILSGEVEMEYVNKHYWKLMKTFVGVMPPNERKHSSFDFPFKFYLDINENRQAMKFVSEILGYQFYKKLCEISGQYPSDQLYNCNFYGNKNVGNALKNMMSLGSTKSFDEVLASLIPEDSHLDVESLLEYYRPVKTWLANQNKESNVQVGWETV